MKFLREGERDMQRVKACGIIIFRQVPELSFLLMKHSRRFDLPKGHVERGETELECAVRETWEETGIPIQHLSLDSQFRYEEVYYPFERQYGGKVEKTLVVFLGWLLDHNAPIQPTEHAGFLWKPWSPRQSIQKYTVDPLLAAIETHYQGPPVPAGHHSSPQ